HASIYVLRPLLTKSRYASRGSIVVGTVAGDLHDIGKNMVAIMLEGAGYTVTDLGIDVPVSGFVQAVQEYKPDILAMSALLTTTMSELGDVVTQLKEAGLRHNVKILVGGGPVTSEFALGIDADAYAANAFLAIEAANRLLTGEVGFFTVS
ncbi:MAG TPA: cobalamin-dependent protein, partial [Bacillota bacterium]|nr:cobalamin-dependent protein [Bacillota bacterium]